MLLQSEYKTESLKLRLLSLCNLSYSDVTIMSISYKLKQNFHANTCFILYVNRKKDCCDLIIKFCHEQKKPRYFTKLSE